MHAARSDLGDCLAPRGEYAEAEPVLLASYTALQAHKGGEYYATRMVRENLYRLDTAWGKPEKAREYEPLVAAP